MTVLFRDTCGFVAPPCGALSVRSAVAGPVLAVGATASSFACASQRAHLRTPSVRAAHRPGVLVVARAADDNDQVSSDPDIAAFEAAASSAVTIDGNDEEVQDPEAGIELDINAANIVDEEDEDWDGVVQELQPPQMYLNKIAISEARERFKRHENDTGSPEYQVASLTTRITYLTTHLRANPKDFSTTRGLLKLVGRRRRLLKYLKAESPSRFNAILEGMKIRVSQELRAM